jgi:membrane associated rhomboid family serine protease
MIAAGECETGQSWPPHRRYDVQATGNGTGSASIPARSERQAMDWSLVLASQDIPTRIERASEGEWWLIVSPGDYQRALDSIRQYRLENRGWRWRKEVLGYDLTLHWGGMLWCVALALIYELSTERFPALHPAWVMKSSAFSAGEWWRIFTAQFLHGDLVHLLSNITTGCLLFGLALGRYGPGCGLLAAWLAGAAGNIAGLLIHLKPYEGLGASGMVMGALGLISFPGFVFGKTNRFNARHCLKGLFAGLLLFVLLGLNPSSDVAAHVGGFVAGVGLGASLNLVPDDRRRARTFQRGCWILLGALLTAAMGASFSFR